MTSRASPVAWPLQLQQACHEFHHYQADSGYFADEAEGVLGSLER